MTWAVLPCLCETKAALSIMQTTNFFVGVLIRGQAFIFGRMHNFVPMVFTPGFLACLTTTS